MAPGVFPALRKGFRSVLGAARAAGEAPDDSGSAPSKDIRASFRKRTKKSAQSKKLFDPTQLKSAGFRSAGSVHVAHGFTLSKNQEPSRNIEKIEVGAT